MASALEFEDKARSLLGYSVRDVAGANSATFLLHMEDIKAAFLNAFPWPFARQPALITPIPFSAATFLPATTDSYDDYVAFIQPPASTTPALRFVTVQDTGDSCRRRKIKWLTTSWSLTGSSSITAMVDTTEPVLADILYNLPWSMIPQEAVLPLAWALAADLAMSLTESGDRGRAASQQAEIELQRLKKTTGQSHKPIVADTSFANDLRIY